MVFGTMGTNTYPSEGNSVWVARAAVFGVRYPDEAFGAVAHRVGIHALVMSLPSIQVNADTSERDNLRCPTGLESSSFLRLG